MVKLLTSQELRRVLETQFPIDTVSWARATDEVRDMCREARETLGLGEEFAVDFQSIRSPSAWNQQGINAIIKYYEAMTEEQQISYLYEFAEWINEWMEP